ncbi:MAG: anhydro-N-acetylmuramic acid kinase, partial [Porticoccaceae bacterium]
MTSANIYIGLMSGTSIDSVDAVAVIFHPDRLQLLGSHSHVIPEELRRSILMLSQASGDTVQLYGETDAALGVLFAEATLAIMSKLSLTADMIMAVGSHGQTVRHRPPSGTALGFSLQIGDA